MPSIESIHRKTGAAAPLHELLDERAARLPDQIAYRYLTDGEETERLLTCGDLAERARILAAGLVTHGATGKPVLLIHPPGLGFIEGLFACWHAGAIAVPAYPPRGGRHRRRLETIISDSGAALALAPSGQLPIPGIRVLESESLLSQSEKWMETATKSSLPCVLQYTSGSTAEPKGVMISHQNIRRHFSALQSYADLGLRSAVSWLPPYHDMGLILKILYSFEAGIPLTFFSPDHFIQRPVRWLRAISNYRAELSGAPNFAFEMCLRSIRDEELAGLDLSCWKAAPCGAERILPDTLDRFARRFEGVGFRREAFLPGYGLAESTLTVTACSGGTPRLSDHRRAGRLVSSGKPLAGVSLRIVDPEKGHSLADGEIGEIRVSGEIISAGYWNRPDATLETFGPSANRELHTGDLGYLDDGELFVTGRIKDLIIIDGTNHSPEDIEAVVFSAAPSITAAAAFSDETNGRESVVIALEAAGLPQAEFLSLCQKVRQGVGEMLEIPVSRLVMVRSGLLPRTTSGKIRRSACRDGISSGKLPVQFTDSAGDGAPSGQPDVNPVLMEIISEVTGRTGASPDDDIIGLGMTSMETTRLAALLKARTGISILIGELFSARSLRQISALITNKSVVTVDFPEVITGSGAGANILTHSQERMWFLHQLDPESAAYHVFGSLEMRGDLNVNAMRKAITAVVSQHDILCSRHGSEDGRPTVRIQRDAPPPIEFSRAGTGEEIQDRLARFARQPFDLAHDTPLRASIISVGEKHHVVSICVHHIVADGWSIRLLARGIAEAYAAIRTDRPVYRPSERMNYLDYAVSHRQWISSGAVDAQIDYWKTKLSGHSGLLQLATDFPRPAEPASEGGTVERVIPAGLCNRVSALAKAHRGTPFMVHLAAFLLLLRRHGAGDDPVVAIPVANRHHAVAGDLIGTLVNTLPFRLPLDSEVSFSALIERIRIATFEMHAAQDAPFEKIIDAIKPDRSRDHSPLAQVMFDYQEIPIAETWEGGVECRPFNAHRGAVQFDLSLLLTVLSDRQQLAIEYRSDLFLPATVERMMERYLETLEIACREPSLSLSEIPVLCDADHTILNRYSNGPIRKIAADLTTPELISIQSGRFPRHTAVVCGGDAVDYQTVETRATSLASALHSQGVRPGDRLAILLERDHHLPVVLLAVWKAGAAYIPLDRSNPPERLKLILDDQQPVRVLTSPHLIANLPTGSSVINFDDSFPTARADFAPHRTTAEDTAYVIYTSGSTGRPKGVVVSHGALANFLQSMAETPGFTAADRLLAVTTISFDISALELFLPLVSGGCVDVVSTETARDGFALAERLKVTRPTIMQATPATWRLLIDSNWQGSTDLKILCGGEALDLPLAQRLRPMGAGLWNLYGPTETTIWSTVWQIPENPQSIRIGQPIANTGIHILAPDGATLPPGVAGELWISGAGLADGYWNRPDLTAEHFVGATERRYRTGDLGRLHPDGSFECLGRTDGQVKIRGFRVELGEIESALARHPKVGQARAALRGSDLSTAKLVAWVVPTERSDPPETTELRDFLDGILPTYMLPTDIGVIDIFPLGSSGKVDVSKLGYPEPEVLSRQPLTPVEQQLAAIWSELLDRPEIRREDDWFHVGGHSLLALRLFSRIRRDFGRTLPLSTILDYSTLGDLASIIDQSPRDPGIQEP